MNSYDNHPLTGAADLDSAFNKLWSFYKKHFPGLYLISVIASLLSTLAMSGIDLSSFQGVTDPEEMLGLMQQMARPYALVMLITLSFGVFLHAWVLIRPVADGSYLSQIIRITLITLVPYLITMILVGIILTALFSIGLVLLILPGLFALFYMITVGLFVMPVMLTETLNPFTALSRAFRLTHNRIWSNLGWVIVVLLIIVVVSMVLAAVTTLPFTGSLIRSFTTPEEAGTALELARNPLYIGLSSLASALITPVMPILAFILYFRNRGEESARAVPVVEETPSVRVEDLYPRMPGDE